MKIKIGIAAVILIIIVGVWIRLANYEKIRKENKQLKTASKLFDKKLGELQSRVFSDSINYKARESEYQKVIADMRNREKLAVNNLQKCELEKDKILRGELCEETYGLFKKKRRLVPCN